MHSTDESAAGSAGRTASLLILAGPVLILTAAAARISPLLLAPAGVAAAAGAILFVRYQRAWRPPASGFALLLYLFALAALVYAAQDATDSFVRVSRGLLLVGAVLLLASHDLNRTGSAPRQKARRLCRKLAARRSWPARFEQYRDLPEVRDLPDALRDDPSPALALLNDSRLEVRAAAFTVLRGRPYWRAVEAAAVMAAARQTGDPSVRAIAAEALATADTPDAVAGMAAMLRDPSAEVRSAAADAVMAGGARRWPQVRDGVREALADPALAEDGPLTGSAGRLPAMAVCDLFTWSNEMEPLSARAVRTLVEHYAALLRSGNHPELAAQLGELAVDAQSPPGLRVELTVLLRDFGLITHELLDRMTDVDQPGAVRLLAAETLLAANPDDADALDVLRGLGRQPNRETALIIARILQGCLGLDMGLPPDQEVSASSKLAAEVAKKVLSWATGGRVTQLADPALRSSRPLSAPTLSGIQGNPSNPNAGSKGSLWSPGR